MIFVFFYMLFLIFFLRKVPINFWNAFFYLYLCLLLFFVLILFLILFLSLNLNLIY